MKKVGIISPSNNVLSYFPNRTETGIENLKQIGLNPVFSKKAIRENNYTKNSVLERVEEINKIIKEDVDLIIASIGGYLSVQLLNFIDYEMIKKKHITFCGSSDITALLLAIYVKTKVIMLYGPTYTVNLCDYGGIDEYTKSSFLNCYKHKNFKYLSSPYIINEFIDWKELEKKPRIKNRRCKNNDWNIINNGKCKGKLIGGNLSTILLILGTEYLPIDIFKNSILFLEDCETNINEFCSYMECMKLNGVFNIVKGIIFGKFDTEEMNQNINGFLKDYFKEYDIPIASNLDFGHVFPSFTLPIGAEAKLDCNDNEINLEVIFN